MIIGKDFNTKDWFVYDDNTGTRIWFGTKEEAVKYIEGIIGEVYNTIGLE